MKRVVRKQLKEDEFVTTINKIATFAKKYIKQLLAVLAVIAVVVIAFIGFRLVESHNIKEESRLLSQIFQLESEIKDNPDKIGELEKLSGNGKFSRLSFTKIASYWMEKGEFDKAISSLEKISQKKKDFFYFQAQDLLAQIYIKQKEYDKAIEIYQKAEEQGGSSYSLDVILFHKAQAYEEKGEKDKALELYKRIQDEFPQTYFGYDASQKVTKLEDKR